MVGDRYRDVLETTDAILSMQRLVDKLTNTMQPLLKGTTPPSPSAMVAHQVALDEKQKQAFVAAALLKLLVDTPEQVISIPLRVSRASTQDGVDVALAGQKCALGGVASLYHHLTGTQDGPAAPPGDQPEYAPRAPYHLGVHLLLS